MTGWMLALATSDGMMMPGIFQPPKQERKTSAAVRETNSQRARQSVEGSTQNQRYHGKLSLRGHAHRPRHHVLRHPLLPKHFPRVDEHGRPFIGAVLQKSHDAGIIQVLASNVVADLHPQVS